jgi:hypothetical protein
MLSKPINWDPNTPWIVIYQIYATTLENSVKKQSFVSNVFVTTWKHIYRILNMRIGLAMHHCVLKYMLFKKTIAFLLCLWFLLFQSILTHRYNRGAYNFKNARKSVCTPFDIYEQMFRFQKVTIYLNRSMSSEHSVMKKKILLTQKSYFHPNQYKKVVH